MRIKFDCRNRDEELRGHVQLSRAVINDVVLVTPTSCGDGISRQIHRLEAWRRRQTIRYKRAPTTMIISREGLTAHLARGRNRQRHMIGISVEQSLEVYEVLEYNWNVLEAHFDPENNLRSISNVSCD